FTRALCLLLLGLASIASAFFTDKRKRFFTERKRFLTGFGPSDGTLKFRRGAMDGSFEGSDDSDFSYLMRKTWIGR
ncbi:hypothetical protein PENTCL1PPCAC_7878, partial [Pristionchus entomophagus]